MKTRKKRMLALLLCIVMCVSLLPVSALADGGTIEAVSEGGVITAAEPEEDPETGGTIVEAQEENTEVAVVLEEAYVAPMNNALEDDNIYFYVSSFTEVKKALAEIAAYEDYYYFAHVYYQGTKTLTISEDITIDKHTYLHAENADVVIPAGVTLTSEGFVWFGKLTVKGTFLHNSYYAYESAVRDLIVEGTFDSNSSSEFYVWNVTGIEQTDFPAKSLTPVYEVSTEQELIDAVAAGDAYAEETDSFSTAYEINILSDITLHSDISTTANNAIIRVGYSVWEQQKQTATLTVSKDTALAAHVMVYDKMTIQGTVTSGDDYMTSDYPLYIEEDGSVTVSSTGMVTSDKIDCYGEIILNGYLDTGYMVVYVGGVVTANKTSQFNCHRDGVECNGEITVYGKADFAGGVNVKYGGKLILAAGSEVVHTGLYVNSGAYSSADSRIIVEGTVTSDPENGANIAVYSGGTIHFTETSVVYNISQKTWAGWFSHIFAYEDGTIIADGVIYNEDAEIYALKNDNGSIGTFINNGTIYSHGYLNPTGGAFVNNGKIVMDTSVVNENGCRNYFEIDEGGSYAGSGTIHVLKSSLEKPQDVLPGFDVEGSFLVEDSADGKYWILTYNNPVTLNVTDLALAVGKTKTLKVTDSQGSTVSASWNSSDMTIASVSKNGVVTAKKVGKAVITAMVNGAPLTCAVRVLFKDVTNPEEFYYDPIYNMVDRGVIGGFDDGTFRPTGNCNRAAVVTFLWRLAGKPEPAAMATFSDMTDNPEFNKAISWAAEQGITTGYAGNLFKPWNTCNRAAIVTFLWRYAGSPKPTAMATFKDMTGNADFDKAISWAAENKITTGWASDNTFRPWNTCNRLAVASFLDRYDNLEPSAGNLKIWSSEAIMELTEEQIEAFMNAHPEYAGYTISVESIKESDATDKMVADPEAGADIFIFPQDQLARLVSAGLLIELSEENAAVVSAENDAGSVAAAKMGGTVYAYPLTSDNGYFLYYDSSVVTDPTSLDRILEDCAAAGKDFYMEINSGWYQAAFFFGAGCTLTYDTDSAGNFIACNCDYASDKGVAALKAMIKLTQSPAFKNGSSVSDAPNAAAIVSGTWDSNAAKELFCDNYACAKLPMFDCNGTPTQLGGFGGFKLLGVKPQTDETKLALCDELAIFLSGGDVQLARYNAVGWGPSNVTAKADPAVQADETLAALGEQLVYATPQGQYPLDYWNLSLAFGNSILAGEYSEASDTTLLAALKAFQDACIDCIG